MHKFTTAVVSALLAGLISGSAQAGDRLAWTGAVTQIEGSAGGGLVPWALIAGLGTADQLGGSGFISAASTTNFSLRTAGLSLGIDDRVEVSVARQRFDAGSVIPGLTLGQDVVGVKVRLAGDAVFAPDQWWPQVAIGAQHKQTLDYSRIPRAVGADSGEGVDLYLAATKVYFAALNGRNVIVNATLRRTRANQFGLLGFGGADHGYDYRPEFSAGVWVLEDLLFGAEYRGKPDNLAAFHEDSAKDVFLAWNPAKPVTLVLAWTDLGRIAGKPVQRGIYASLWVGL
jgi:Protein of unknown function (DUF3034)